MNIKQLLAARQKLVRQWAAGASVDFPYEKNKERYEHFIGLPIKQLDQGQNYSQWMEERRKWAGKYYLLNRERILAQQKSYKQRKKLTKKNDEHSINH